MKVHQYSLETLAHLVQGELFGDAALKLSGLASLEHADNQHIAFVNGEKYLDAAISTQAGALIVQQELKEKLTQHQNFIVVDNPYLAFAKLTHVFEKAYANWN